MDLEKRTAAIAAVQAKYDDYLMAFPKVVGTGIGYRQRAGKRERELCLVVMVTRKLAPWDLTADATLPRELDAVPIDVIETGEFVV